jgi:hypothetical protein
VNAALAEIDGSSTANTFTASFSAALSWTVNHNLGRKPIVAVFNSGGAEIEAEIVHVSNNQLVVYFVISTAGSIRCF